VALYSEWHRLQVTTDDLDPAYPVLRELSEAWALDRDALCWLIALHVAYYHLGSALVAFSRTNGEARGLPGTPEALRASGLLDLPTATERRGHRTRGPLANHLLAIGETHREGGWQWYEQSGWDWTRLNDQLVTVTGNGRWAAYKTAELVQKVAGAPLVAADAGHRYSSGPRKGLELLFADLPTGQTPDVIAALDRATSELAAELGEPDLAQVETSLCDFHSLAKGGYYLGHDIDAMQGQLLDPRVPDPTPPEVWDARATVFSPDLLGEVNGWMGPRRALKPLFRHYGVLDWRGLP
jgi:hypothetical protein